MPTLILSRAGEPERTHIPLDGADRAPAGGSRRPGAPLSIGAPGSDRELAGVGAGRLEVHGPPWRVERTPGSAELEQDGRRLGALALAQGTRFGWAGWQFEFRADGDAVGAGERSSASGASPAPVLSPAEPRAWRWLKAGVAIEQGLCDRSAAKTVQESVRAGTFDPDGAADRVLDSAPLEDFDPRLEQRSARLLRDLAMAPTLRGTGKVARAGRGCFRGFAAFALVQLVGLVVFVVLVLALFLGLRWQGRSLDAHADRILDALPLPEPAPPLREPASPLPRPGAPR